MYKFLETRELLSFSLVDPLELEIRESSSSSERTFPDSRIVGGNTREIRVTKRSCSFIRGTKIRHGPFDITETKTQKSNMFMTWINVQRETGAYFYGKLHGVKTETVESGEKGEVAHRRTTTTTYKRGVLDGEKAVKNPDGNVVKWMLFREGKFIKENPR
ncbi:hypothetical protein ISTM_235 [Insectomime virus]|nr:hypothetical protein ISTM_235 [Insectomime virus]